jgi:hypothetical protein
MGYDVMLIESNVILLVEQEAEILRRWKLINNESYNDKKSGYSYDKNNNKKHHYAWLDADYDRHVNKVEDILTMLRFEYSHNERGDIIIEDFDNKMG